MDQQQAINDLHQRLRRVATFFSGWGYLGRGDGTSTVVADSARRMVYYFTEQGIGTARLAENISMPSVNDAYAVGLRVQLGYPPHDPHVLYVLGFDTGEGLAQLGGLTPAEQYNAASKYPDTGRIINFRIAPQDTPDKTVAVQGGAYITPGGQWAFFLQDSIDLTTQIAAISASNHQLCVVCLDTLTGLLAAVTSGSEAGGVNDKTDFGVGTIEALTFSSNYAPVGAVHLYNGQTTISESDLYREADPRVFLRSMTTYAPIPPIILTGWL